MKDVRDLVGQALVWLPALNGLGAWMGGDYLHASASLLGALFMQRAVKEAGDRWF